MIPTTGSRKTLLASIVVATMVLGGAAYFGLDILRSAAANESRSDIGNVKQSANRIVAVVDGAEIAEAELLPFLNAGLDKAVAVDRAINKVVAANSADKLYRQVAKTALQSARNEVLASVFINQRSQEVRNSVTEKDIKTFYENRVKADDFTTFKLKFFVSVDGKEAQDVFDGVGRGEKEAMAKLTWVRKDGEHYLTAAEVPYGLGVAVKKLKAGQRLQPVTVREGTLVLYVDDIKSNPKPELAKVEGEIKDLLVAERFNEDMKARRAAAKIELRS
ncbi:peptidylprolyl isomerase [Actimicrobium sp. CCC2.4]|uniref:peptidylprolyl isomerase n=1 Tax=Actimicrobium sp. CCC2.4 TaxID=3048606 RepID=UPI002AC9BD38|nr:peptidylprolyl isomerase [Actimicrobium sp. CCC2.4]MEB0135317.1 peptidylprolyl isomerase [Actimicrobium sp. CCC2.4]WPX31106.1 peptidylprolyl isomerase [Actimicrobium sp. CCC2.4]